MQDVKELVEYMRSWDGVGAWSDNGEFIDVDYRGVFELLSMAAAALEEANTENESLRSLGREVTRCLKIVASGHCCDVCANKKCLDRGYATACTAFRLEGFLSEPAPMLKNTGGLGG